MKGTLGSTLNGKFRPQFAHQATSFDGRGLRQASHEDEDADAGDRAPARRSRWLWRARGFVSSLLPRARFSTSAKDAPSRSADLLEGAGTGGLGGRQVAPTRLTGAAAAD